MVSPKCQRSIRAPTSGTDCRRCSSRAFGTLRSKIDSGHLLVSGGIQSTSGGTGADTESEILTFTLDGQACSTNCECASGLCEAGSCCASTRNEGEPCTDRCQCLSGFCVDGVCCDTACDEPCRACSAISKDSGPDGVCGNAKEGADPHGNCEDEGPESCGTTGACNGNGACATYGAGVACASPECNKGQLITAACNAGRQCVTKTEVCRPFACGGEPPTCLTQCSKSDDCAEASVCIDGRCVTPCDQHCGAYACHETTGACKTSCVNSDDCQAPFLCDFNHECITAPDVRDETLGGCCAVVGERPGAAWHWVVLPAALGAACTRRRRRR
jgi:hypothetical protein